MNALIDRHHHGLFYGLQLLFEDRLGGKVYTPIGHDWWDQGYWRFGEVFGDDRLAQQYLNETPWMGEGIAYNVDQHHPERRMAGVTLEAARGLQWDYVVATVQENQAGFKRFADEVGAKFVYQVGNHNQQVDWSLDPLALVSSEIPIAGRGVVIHQEFDFDTVFAYREPNGERTIRSFVNCLGSTSCGALFDQARILLPEFTFGVHGIDGPDGNIETVTEIADLMAGSAFGWHDKVQGDGFGHVIHDWAAVGRPLIGHASHYAGLMAEGFWQDMVTCIDLDKHSISEAAELVRVIVADAPRHRVMCQTIRAEFDKIDWDAEAASIRALLA